MKKIARSILSNLFTFLLSLALAILIWFNAQHTEDPLRSDILSIPVSIHSRYNQAVKETFIRNIHNFLLTGWITLQAQCDRQNHPEILLQKLHSMGFSTYGPQDTNLDLLNKSLQIR